MAEARGLVISAGVAAQVAAATVGVLPFTAVPVTAGLLIGLGYLSGRLSGTSADRLRTSATAVAGVVILCFLPIIAIGGTDDLKDKLGLLLVVAQLGQVCGWRTPRDERVALLCSLGLLVLASSYSPDVFIGAPILVGWFATLLALARLAGVRGAQLVGAGATALVLGLAAFLLLPLPKGAGVHSRLASGSSSNQQRQQTATRASAGTEVFSQSHLDLDLRGPLATDPVLSVPSDSPTLWRSAVYDTYDGQGWDRAPSVATTHTSVLNRSSGPGPTASYSAVPLQADAGDVYAPGQIVQFSTQQSVDIIETSEGELQVDPVTPYTVKVTPPVTSLAALDRTAGVQQTDPRYTALPGSVPSRVHALALQVTSGQLSPWKSAQSIAAYLDANEKYTLNSPVPKAGQDAVDRFLFVDHLGFCEQFASAEVVLLRSVGIPSRLVTGLAYGTPQGGSRLYRAKDLHAWVELWVPGTGWVISDPTAGAALAPGSTGMSARSRLAATITRFLHRLTHIPGGRATLAALLLVALVLFGALARLVLGRRGRLGSRAPAQPRIGPALAAYLRLDARLGDSARKPAESVREHGVRLDPVVAPALAIVEQELYGRSAPPADLASQAAETLDKALNTPDRALNTPDRE